MALLPKLTSYVCNIRQLSLTSCFLKASPIVKGELPKKPPSPWSSYYATKFPEVKGKNPHLATTEIMRIISGNWKGVSEAEKNRLQDIYEVEKKMYLDKLEKVPVEILQKVKEGKKETRALKKGKNAAKDLKKLNEELEKPKRNLNPYLLYAQDRRPNLAATMKGKEKVKIIAQEWRDLPTEMREKYEMKAQQDKERYMRAKELWSAKLVENGGEEQISKLKKLASKKKNKD